MRHDIREKLRRSYVRGGLMGDRWDDCEPDNPTAHRLGYVCEYE